MAKIPDVERTVDHLTRIWTQLPTLSGKLGAPAPTPPSPAGSVDSEGFRLNELPLCIATAREDNRASATSRYNRPPVVSKSPYVKRSVFPAPLVPAQPRKPPILLFVRKG